MMPTCHVPPLNAVEEERLAALARYQILDTLPEDDFDRYAQLAACGLDQPIALVSFADATRHWLKAKVGLSDSAFSRGDAFCDQTLRQDDVLVVPDAREDPRFRRSRLVAEAPHIRFYAGAPLRTPDGHAIGTLCVLSPDPGDEFGAPARQFLRQLAQTVMTELELRQSFEREREIAGDLAFKNRLSAAIAEAPDFDSALVRALALCTERTGAALCLLAQAHPAFGIARYVASFVDPQGCAAALDVGAWVGTHPAGHLSFGTALLQGEIYDSGPLDDPAAHGRFAVLQDLIRAGIRRQIVHPFDLGEHRFGLVLDFPTPQLGENAHALVQSLIIRLAPLLLGRLRERALEHANRALRTLHACNDIFAAPESPQQLYEAACRLAVDIGGYESCWIGLAEADSARSIRPVAWAGRALSVLPTVQMSWDDQPHGRGPAGTAIRDNRIIVSRELAQDRLFAPWRHLAVAAGFRTCISLPITSAAGPATAAFTFYSSDPTAFESVEQGLLADLVANLAKALRTLSAQRERDAAITARATTERRLAHLLSASGVVLYALALQEGGAALAEVSPNVTALLGYAPAEVLAPGWWRDHVHPDDLQQAGDALLQVLSAGQCNQCYRLRDSSGAYRWLLDEMTLQRDAEGKPRGIVGVWIDVTERYAAEEHIYRLANLDPLTDLPNRRLLNARLDHALVAARRSRCCGAVLFIDLDRFKPINDMLGHAAGDKVLREVATRLAGAVRAGDTVARVGGDEFVVLLSQLRGDRAATASHVGTIARKLIDAIAAKPVVLDAREYHLSASIGFSVFPKAGDTVDSLMREADTAMYRAKSGASRIVMFEPEMHLAVLAEHALEDELRNALRTDRFETWLQSQVDANGAELGAEALIRLRSPEGQLRPPGEFIPIAEASGLIVPMGRWILRDACRLLTEVHRVRPDWTISVNVSPRQFRDADFVAEVFAALEAAAAPAHRLTLEITESLLIENTAAVGRTMERLAERGVRFSVDDFGTGYSSLHYLRHLPIHEIKIDRSFISQVPEDLSAVAIVEAILAMAQRLGIAVVAEGVETRRQKIFLSALGCSRMQGFLFGKPAPAARWRTGCDDNGSASAPSASVGSGAGPPVIATGAAMTVSDTTSP